MAAGLFSSRKSGTVSHRPTVSPSIVAPMSRHILILVLSALALSVTSLTAQQPQAELVSVEKIWDKAKHNGFTDITRFKNLFICAFREGDDHIGGDGQIRVLISSSGKTWVEQALVSEKGVDLRDPKLTIAPPRGADAHHRRFDLQWHAHAPGTAAAGGHLHGF